MHPYDVMIIVSVTCMVGFIAIIYVDDDLPLALGYIGSSIVGCALGGYLGFWYLPIQPQFGLIAGAFWGGITLILCAKVIRRRWP
jgi:hypothetical protein